MSGMFILEASWSLRKPVKKAIFPLKPDQVARDFLIISIDNWIVNTAHLSAERPVCRRVLGELVSLLSPTYNMIFRWSPSAHSCNGLAKNTLGTLVTTSALPGTALHIKCRATQ